MLGRARPAEGVHLLDGCLDEPSKGPELWVSTHALLGCPVSGRSAGGSGDDRRGAGPVVESGSPGSPAWSGPDDGAHGRLRLLHLPAYSFQLNPDEWAWNKVKSARIGRAGITTVEELRNKALCALLRLRETPELVLGFFRDPDLRYISAAEG